MFNAISLFSGFFRNLTQRTHAPVLPVAVFLTLTALMVPAVADVAVTGVSFWVSPSGKDSNPGTKSLPFKSLSHAQSAVQSVLAGAIPKNVTVNLEPGIYRLSAPLDFTPADSPRDGFRVTWRSSPGAPLGMMAEVVGSVPVTGWVLHDATKNIYKAHVGTAVARQLYVDGERAVRARTGKNPVGFLPVPISLSGYRDAAQIDGGISYIVSDANPAGWRDPSTWTDVSGVEAVIATQWRMMRVPVHEVVPGTSVSILNMQQPAWTNANLYLGKNGQPGIWSFWQVSWFENALQFLDEPGEWYLQPDPSSGGTLYYMAEPGKNPASQTVELPVAEQLIRGKGTPGNPVKNITFSNIAFKFATWNAPSTENGYVADQGSFFVTGPFITPNGEPASAWRTPNKIGHVETVTSTPGNISFEYASNVVLAFNRFEGLGGIGVAFEKGSQNNSVVRNTFAAISSAAIRLGGVSKADARPEAGDAVSGNKIERNLVLNTGRDYYDAPGIVVGFTKDTLIAQNEIDGTSWAGIAIGWGWGLLDAPSYPGLTHAKPGQWGTFNGVQTINDGNEIRQNWIRHFLQELWDGGAVYTTGQQGRTSASALKIRLNVATGRGLKDGRRASGGGNTFYTDGGSRHVLLERNLSENNPVGRVNFGPPPPADDPLPYPAQPSSLNDLKYGSEIGGCATYGDIAFNGNYWAEKGLSGIDPTLLLLFAENDVLGDKSGMKYIEHGFFNVCPTKWNGAWYPKDMTFKGNVPIIYEGALADAIRKQAGIPR